MDSAEWLSWLYGDLTVLAMDCDGYHGYVVTWQFLRWTVKL